MAEFVPPQFNNPDFLRSAALGQQMGIQAQLAPGELQGQQQSLETGKLNMDQLRMAMQYQQMKQNALAPALQEMARQGQPGQSQGAQAPGGGTGGIQNGPQSSASGDNQNYGFSPDNMSQVSRRIVGALAPEMLKGMDEGDASALKAAQLRSQLQGSPLSVTQSFASNPQAGAALLRPENARILAHWPTIAARYGLNAQDLSDYNVRLGATLEANTQRAGLQLPALPMPEQPVKNVNLGQGEIAQINLQTGKKVGDLVERQTPSFTLKDIYDPSTNSTRAVPVQTGGYGMSGTNPNSAGGGPPGGGVNLGMKAPTDPELKAAMFGSEMRSGMNTLNKMESQGFSLSPKTRTLLINAATSEDEGVIKQFLSQESLAHMSPKDQTYIAALMPVLQAAGHDQSGARLTTSQVRQNIESLLPVDVKNKDAMDQIKQNRQGFYNGLLTQAGSAAQLPQYKNTLGSDLSQAQGRGNAPAAAISHLKAHPELAAQFKAKYGYLPGG